MLRNRDDVPAALRKPEPPVVPRIGLRPAEAAKAIGCCEKWLRDLGDKGPPVARFDRMVIYPCDLLAGWLRDRAEAPADVPGPAAD